MSAGTKSSGVFRAGIATVENLDAYLSVFCHGRMMIPYISGFIYSIEFSIQLTWYRYTK